MHDILHPKISLKNCHTFILNKTEKAGISVLSVVRISFREMEKSAYFTMFRVHLWHFGGFVMEPSKRKLKTTIVLSSLAYRAFL